MGTLLEATKEFMGRWCYVIWCYEFVVNSNEIAMFSSLHHSGILVRQEKKTTSYVEES